MDYEKAFEQLDAFRRVPANQKLLKGEAATQFSNAFEHARKMLDHERGERALKDTLQLMETV